MVSQVRRNQIIGRKTLSEVAPQVEEILCRIPGRRYSFYRSASKVVNLVERREGVRYFV